MNEDKLNYNTLARVQSQALPVWFSCPGGSSHQDCLLRDPYEMNEKGQKKRRDELGQNSNEFESTGGMASL